MLQMKLRENVKQREPGGLESRTNIGALTRETDKTSKVEKWQHR